MDRSEIERRMKLIAVRLGIDPNKVPIPSQLPPPYPKMSPEELERRLQRIEKRFKK